jgi:AcrR family transcriptional regulator
MVQIAAADSNKVLEKKRGILDAASRVFRRKGLHATGMREGTLPRVKPVLSSSP